MSLTTLLLLATLAAWACLAFRLPRVGKVGLLARLRLVFAGGQVGALTLAQSAVLNEDEHRRGIIETFVQESPLLDRLPFMDIEGGAFKYDEELTLPGVEFRAVNAAYAESTGTFNQRTESIVDLGGDADVDRFIQVTRGRLYDQRAEQDRLKVKAISYKYQDAFVNGDTAVDANGFDGIKKRVTGGQVIDAATNGLGPVSGGHDFFDALDAVIAAVMGDVDALFMNRAIRTKIMSAGRRLGGVDWIKEAFFEETGTPSVKRIPTYNGIPMLDLGVKLDGTDILPRNEVQGTSTAASSIYAVRFARSENEHGVAGLTNGGIDVRDLGEQQVKPVYRTRVQWFTGLGAFGKGAARLRGVTNT